MYSPFWEAVGRLERCGFRVMALICDGLAANGRFFRLHDPLAGPGDVYSVINPYSIDNRKLYFLSAYPQDLIKTVRNAWSDQKRKLWCRGKDITWNHLNQLYEKNRSQSGLALIPKLKFETTSFSKMRVDLAAQVLCDSVSKGLKLFVEEEAEEIAIFADYFIKFFNVSTFSAGKLSRSAFKSPYQSGSDFRLKWLKQNFLGYLHDWQGSVMTREGYGPMEKKMMMLSDETLRYTSDRYNPPT